MAKRSLYSRVTRRLRHIADADEVRGLRKSTVPKNEAEAPAPLLRYLQPIVALAGALALVALLVWFFAHVAG